MFLRRVEVHTEQPFLEMLDPNWPGCLAPYAFGGGGAVNWARSAKPSTCSI
jgi:hypothetical protein